MRPWEHLPLPPPSEFDPSVEDPDFFYREFIQPLTADFIRLMSAGLHVDQEAIETLRSTVTDVVEGVQKTLNENPIIQEFQNDLYKIKYQQYLDEMETKKKPLAYFIKDYKPDNMIHRTYLVNHILELQGLEKYKLDKWAVKDIKTFLTIENVPELHMLLEKKSQSKLQDEAMAILAKDKMEIYNKSHYSDKIANKTRAEILPDFNAGSAQQKQKLFAYLNVEPLKLSKDTGEPSWDRNAVEQLQKMTPDTETDLLEILQAFIDYSFSNIIKTNFMEAFDRFVIDDVLYGNFKLFGAKTARP